MFYILGAPSFGAKHLLGLLFVTIFVVIGLVLLSKKQKKDVYLFFVVSFWVLELLKIGYMIIRDGSYPMNHLPFHLCSIPLFIWPVLYFIKEGSKFEKYALPTAFVTVIGGALAALLEPGNIIGAQLTWFPLGPNYLPIVSFVYHGMMVMSALYLIITGIYKPKYSDVIKVMPFTLAFMVMAMITNAIFDQDYMLLKYGKGSPFQFVYNDFSPIIYTLTMIVVGLIVIGIISAVSTTIYKLSKRN